MAAASLCWLSEAGEGTVNRSKSSRTLSIDREVEQVLAPCGRRLPARRQPADILHREGTISVSVGQKIGHFVGQRRSGAASRSEHHFATMEGSLWRNDV